MKRGRRQVPTFTQMDHWPSLGVGEQQGRLPKRDAGWNLRGMTNRELSGTVLQAVRAQSLCRYDCPRGSCGGWANGIVRINHGKGGALDREGLFKHHSGGTISGWKTAQPYNLSELSLLTTKSGNIIMPTSWENYGGEGEVMRKVRLKCFVKCKVMCKC